MQDFATPAGDQQAKEETCGSQAGDVFTFLLTQSLDRSCSLTDTPRPGASWPMFHRPSVVVVSSAGRFAAAMDLSLSL